MGVNELVTERFTELEKKAASVSETRDSAFLDGDEKKCFTIATPSFKAWGTSVLNLLKGVFGKDSIQYQNFYEHYKKFTEWEHKFEDCRAIFQAVKEGEIRNRK